MTDTDEIAEMLEKIPWLILLGIILVLNIALNYTDASLYALVPNAITGLVSLVVLGYYLYDDPSEKDKSSFNIFLMTGIFLLSSLLFWFNAGQSLLTFSTWGLCILDIALAVITTTGFKEIGLFGKGVVWYYASLMLMLFIAVAGMFVGYPQFGVISQVTLWNGSLALLSIAYLAKPKSKITFGILAFVAVIIAVIAAFGFAGQDLSLFPI